MQRKTKPYKYLGVFGCLNFTKKEDFLSAASGLSPRHDLVPMALPVVFARVQVGNWSRCWQKDEVKPKKRKKRVEANVLFLFESFDVIHCSIWHFVLNELSWCHVTLKGAMPSSSAPKIHSPWTSPLLDWWPMEDPDFSWLWRIPPGTVGTVGTVATTSREDRRDAMWDGSWRFPSWRFHDFDSKVGWCPARNVPPLAAVEFDRCRKLQVVSGVSGGTFFYFNSSGLISW